MLSQVRFAARMLVQDPDILYYRGAGACLGTVIDLVLAFFSTRVLSALLYHVGAFDAATFILVPFALGGSGPACQLHPHPAPIR